MKDITKILFIVFLILLAVRISFYYLPAKRYFKPSYEINITEPRQISVGVEIKENKRNVAFDQSHNSLYSVYSNYSEFASLFQASKSEVSALEKFKLQDVDVLVLLSPTSDYSQEEIEEILNAVSKGMTLIILGEREVSEEMNKITFDFGISFAKDVVYDLYNYSVLYKNPIISEFFSSPLTQNVTEIALYDACSIAVSGGASKVAVAGMNAKSTLNKGGRLSIIAISKHDLGKIFAVCDSDLFSNKYIGNFDNEVLARNLVNWS